jgi:hypothetical protein
MWEFDFSGDAWGDSETILEAWGPLRAGPGGCGEGGYEGEDVFADQADGLFEVSDIGRGELEEQIVTVYHCEFVQLVER